MSKTYSDVDYSRLSGEEARWQDSGEDSIDLEKTVQTTRKNWVSWVPHALVLRVLLPSFLVHNHAPPKKQHPSAWLGMLLCRQGQMARNGDQN